MTGRRICYLLTVAIGFVFFCFYQQWFSWLLLVGILWLPLVSLLLSLPAICTARVRIRAPEQTRAGMPARASLQIEGLFPQMPIRCKVGLENRLTGERYVGKPGELIPTDHCGLMVLQCRKLWFYDYLGLWRFSKTAQIQEKVYILPRPLPEQQLPAPEQMPVRAWKPKPGGGNAEYYDLRPYRPGDELRQIHWKLSAKAGQWIYREAMEPVQKRVILSLTLSGSPEELDRKLGRMLGVSCQLLAQGVAHQVCCHTGAGLLELDICDRDSQESALYALLEGTPTQGEAHSCVTEALWHCRIGGEPDEA